MEDDGWRDCVMGGGVIGEGEEEPEMAVVTVLVEGVKVIVGVVLSMGGEVLQVVEGCVLIDDVGGKRGDAGL